MTSKVEIKLIEFESMLDASVQRVGRAVKNLQQEMGGFSSKVPGSGEPGAGKGARATVYVADESDPVTREQLEPDVYEGEGKKRKLVKRGRDVLTSTVSDGSVAVPVTSVEVQALGFAGVDQAARDLARLRRAAIDVAIGLRTASSIAGLLVAGPGVEAVDGADRMVVLDYALLRKLQQAGPRDDPRVLRQLRSIDRSVGRVYSLCSKWGYTPGVPNVSKHRAELLAIDLTDQWCTSHLRVGDRRHRSRGELCDWCYRHGPLLAASWVAPPLDLVRLHVDHGKVYAHEVEPFLKAERDRQRNRVKASHR